MLSKKMVSFKKLAKKVKVKGKGGSEASQRECLLGEQSDQDQEPNSASTPTGFFAIYVGEGRERFVVPTNFLLHPLFKMLLEKSYNESSGLDQSGHNRLVVPCNVFTFQEVVSAIECCHGTFDFGNLVEEFL